MENSYPVIAAPPVSPAMKVNARDPGSFGVGILTAVRFGAPGIVAGVIALLATLHSPVPIEFTARIRK
jgi:hypothetical protein